MQLAKIKNSMTTVAIAHNQLIFVKRDSSASFDALTPCDLLGSPFALAKMATGSKVTFNACENASISPLRWRATAPAALLFWSERVTSCGIWACH